MPHRRGSRDERGRTGVMCGMVSPGNVAAMVMKSFAACETCMASISSGARHRPETNGARGRVAKNFRCTDRNGSRSLDARRSTTRARSCFGFAWDDSFGLDPSLRSARARTPGLAAARTMSELLRRWLRDDVGVTQHVDSFESAFASGFLFGEILARCNVQPDFAKFVNKNTPDARINNFTRLQVRRFSGDFLEATRSTPPDSLAVRGRADTPRASTDELARVRTSDPAKHLSVRSTASDARVPLVSSLLRDARRVSPPSLRALSLTRQSVHLHASTPRFLYFLSSHTRYCSTFTPLSRPCKSWASPWTRAR